AQFRGFGFGQGGTAGDPLRVEWGEAAFNSRHYISYSLRYTVFDFLTINWSGQVRSGTRFTPMVSGDVNGDGNRNDRAFLFAPSATTDTAIANGMQALLANGSKSARDCLSGQLGRIAAPNSCLGPWTTSATLGLSFVAWKARLPQRSRIDF